MSINTNIVSTTVRSAVEKNMSKSERSLFKANGAYAFVVIELPHSLKRWGNKVEFAITSASGALGRNSLLSSAWSDDEDEAWAEAREALTYFVCEEAKITVAVIEKGDYPWWSWDRDIEPADAEDLLTEAFGTKAEVYGKDFILTVSPTRRSLRWKESESCIEYDLDSLKSRHKGLGNGCYWTEWQ